jgi:hypothetical protein
MRAGTEGGWTAKSVGAGMDVAWSHRWQPASFPGPGRGGPLCADTTDNVCELKRRFFEILQQQAVN